MIKEGRITVNGEPANDLSLQVDLLKDKIAVDGKPLYKKPFDYVVLYKPKGVVTTCDDEQGRCTVIDLMPPELQHLKPVSRLDRDSEGMIILTNDGALAADSWRIRPITSTKHTESQWTDRLTKAH